MASSGPRVHWERYSRLVCRAARPRRGASRSTADAWSDFSNPSAVLRVASRGASAAERGTADGSSEFSNPSAVAMDAPKPCAGPSGGRRQRLRSAGRRSEALRTARAIFPTRLQLAWRASGVLERSGAGSALGSSAAGRPARGAGVPRQLGTSRGSRLEKYTAHASWAKMVPEVSHDAAGDFD